MSSHTISRRAILNGIGTSIIGHSCVGVASPTSLSQYIVGSYGDSSRERIKQAANSVRRELQFDRNRVAVCGQFSEGAVERLKEDPAVRYVEQHGHVEGDKQFVARGTDQHAGRHPEGGEQTVGTLEKGSQTVPSAIEQINAAKAIEQGKTGDGVHVAIIDSGIQSDHEDLEANLGEGWAAPETTCTEDCSRRSSNDCLQSWDDTTGHGTMSAGIVGAHNDEKGIVGVAPGVTLHAVKVLDCNLTGSYEAVAEGLKLTADKGWDIANLSFGLAEKSDLIRDAIEYAYNRDVVMVAAAGNGGPCDDCVYYPAAYDDVIAVSAIDQSNKLLDRSSTGNEIELAAPGQDVRTTVLGSEYDEFLNTSAASPFVSGAVAQLFSTGYDTAESRQRLRETADDIGLASDKQGSGRVNVAAALDLDTDKDADTVDTDPTDDIVLWLRDQIDWLFQ